MTVTCSTCPDWLSMSSGSLTGTPDDSDVGSNSVTLRANDGTTNTDQSFTVTVSNVNDAGIVTLTGTSTEGNDYTAAVSDDDGLTGVTITYTWQRSSDGSSWSDISGAASQATYTLVQADVGNYVRVYVSYTDQDSTAESLSLIHI